MRILLVEEDGTLNKNDRVQKELKQYGYTVDRLNGKVPLNFICSSSDLIVQRA
ncbi:MAG: hypothetical protein WAL30_05180 [Candidatus Aquirickettsiella sp.]